MDKKRVKRGIIFVTCAILMYFAVRERALLFKGLSDFIYILRPLLIGLGLAFVLNIPYGFFLRLYRKAFGKEKKRLTKTLALITTYILATAVLVGIIFLFIPQIIQSIEMFSGNLEGYYQGVLDICYRIVEKIGIGGKTLETINETIYGFAQKLPELLLGAVGDILGIAMNFLLTVKDIVIGTAVSVYTLYNKKRLSAQINKTMKALMSEKVYGMSMRFLRAFNGTFRRFIGGQMVESFIMGAMCWVTMKIFGFEYAFVISTFVGITNVIPMFGPIIGAIPGVVILFMVKPIKALWFAIMCFILQQIEANLIYPRVVGESVGLPSGIVFGTVILGGGLFGIVGMIFAVPVVSIIYDFGGQLLKYFKGGKRIKIFSKNKEKNITATEDETHSTE